MIQQKFVELVVVDKIPYRVSDHTPSLLCIPTLGKAKRKPFKFFNVLTTHELFLDVVKTEWDHYISGFFMFRVVKKLKNLKKPLRKLLYDKGNVHANVNKLRTDLDAIQTALDADPFNVALREREATCVIEFNEAVLTEERFLKQKAKIQWLKEGDANSAYFHKAVKSRVSRSRIDTVTNSEGVVFDNNTVHDAFVMHYEMFLGHEGETSNFNYANLFNVRINDQDAQDMVREISNQEVKDAIFSIGDDKSPGPDGFTAAFFKEAWNIIANDVYLAVREFFRNGTLLKEINHTIIALLPKVKSPSRVNDYRPISCCNVLFKCISKIIANRIKHSLKTIISPNQSAFIPGRSITDNILLTQELMHNYHLERGTPRCAFKVDIQKAYDTVDWDFLRIILLGFGFHQKMVSWIMECVTSTSYSICVNGSLHGYFKGKRGLRQGDPLSPYLFTLVMEVLTLMLQRKVQQTDEFTYHRFFRLKKVQLRIKIGKTKSLSYSEVGCNYSLSPWFSLLSYGASVAWEIVCLPKHEGGLGIRRLECFNSALMASHIWKLLTLKESLWVKWIHEYKLKGRNFWDFPMRGNMSWGWRKILKLRPIIRKFIWSKIGNGRNTSLWFDTWADFEPLAAQISPRDIVRSGLSLQSKVQDVIHHGLWKFSVSQVWDDIRHRESKVNWYSMVWFPSCIPRHAINLWLIIRRKLKTQDLVPMWDVSDSLGMVCSLCESVPDSHDHLFFECPFANGIWDRVKVCAGLAHYTPNVYVIIQALMPIMKRRTTNSVVAKLVVAAATYYVWQERNWRLFKKGKRSPDQIVECIKSSVRLKLLSCKLKKSKNGERLARLWDLPEAVFK
ncbi:hypothetical protein Tco_0256799 [Tanacetum coccineum]